ncbi:MAG: DNA-processing protein DprA [Conchiformibius sp.]|nr:DNA-processing protein DprA [Conchiformibius sp.]
MSPTERRAWIQLALTPHIGAESFLRLLQHTGSAEAALALPPDSVRTVAVRGKQAAAAWTQTDSAQRAADAALAWEQQDGCRLLLLSDPDFPSLLGEGQTPPPLLFARGDTRLLHRSAVGIVGSRHATPQAQRHARNFAAELSARGICVVSGMASGIDAAAHEGALTASGSTVAVWGTGIDRIYPAANQDLARRIAENGLVLSEFPLGTRPMAGNFPRRNRLIAAQSRAVLVVEAALESGSLITARLAAEMGRDVMALPGPIDNPHSKGCHKLIKDGAKLVESVDDILAECPALLQAAAPPAPAFGQALAEQARLNETAPPPSAAALLAQMGYEAVHPDYLAETLGLPAAEVYALLLECELNGTVAAMTGGRFQRVG